MGAYNLCNGATTWYT